MSEKVIDLVNTNVFALRIDDPLITVDMNQIAKVAAENRAARDAAHAKDNPPDESQVWRDELAELERRLTGYLTPEQAQRFADEQNAKHKENVQKLVDEITYVRSLLKTPGLNLCRPRREGKEPKAMCGCDGCVFQQRINLLEAHLASAKNAQQKAIKQSGATIANAKELSKLVPRYQELAKKARKIDTARKVAKGMIDGRIGAEPEPRNNHMLSRDYIR